MDIKTKTGQRIKEIRTEKGLTQEAVAFKAVRNILYSFVAGIGKSFHNYLV